MDPLWGEGETSRNGRKGKGHRGRGRGRGGTARRKNHPKKMWNQKGDLEPMRRSQWTEHIRRAREANAGNVTNTLQAGLCTGDPESRVLGLGDKVQSR